MESSRWKCRRRRLPTVLDLSDRPTAMWREEEEHLVVATPLLLVSVEGGWGGGGSLAGLVCLSACGLGQSRLVDPPAGARFGAIDAAVRGGLVA